MWRRAERGALLAAAASTAVALGADCPAPILKLAASAARPQQGGIVALTLSSSAPLTGATVVYRDRRFPMEREAKGGGRVFRALVGIDFESAIGERKLEVEAAGLCGDEHAASRELRVVSGHFPQQTLTVDPAYVEPPPSEKERIEREHAEVERVWAAPPTPRRWHEPFRLPVDAPVRPNFGARRLYNGQHRSSHSGTDLAAPAGAAVAAPAPGTVVLAEEMYFSGGTVILDHGAGLFTTYFHLSRIDVKAGDRLEAGGVLGAVGATGRVTGPHLHWGARVNGARINPLALRHLPTWPL